MRRLIKPKLTILLAIFLIATVVYSANQQIWVKVGFGTGQTYIDMSESEQRAYAMGAINGILLAPFFGATKEE